MSTSGFSAVVGDPHGGPNIKISYVHLCTLCVYDGDERFYQGYVAGMQTVCCRCGVRDSEEIYGADVNDPRLMGYGSPEAVACVTVDLYHRIIWDVNRYYERLGVDVRATKRQIKERYQEIDGQQSVEMTYIVKRLLDDDFRDWYDGRPLGKIVIDDQIIDSLRKSINNRISQQLRDGEIEYEDAVQMGGGLIREEDSYDEWGSPEAALDAGPTEGQTRPGRWAWGYYVCRSGSKDFERLAWWQGALASAIAEREEGLKFAVGFLGHSDVAWEVAVLGNRVVAFLNDREWPNEQYVAGAATRVCTLSGGK